MLSLIFSILACTVCYFGLHYAWPDHIGWTITLSVIAFLAVWIGLNLLIMKKLEKIFKSVQEFIQGAQDKLRREINMYQQKGMVGPRMQEKIEEKLKASIKEAIEKLEEATPLRKWNWLVGKQTDTMKAQLLYQIKDYDAADPLLDKALPFDPMITAMKIARYYKRGMRDKVTKTYNSGIKRFKGDKKISLYALDSWILVKEDKIQEAVVVLDEGKTKTDSPVLKDNWEHLVNNRVKRFSNAGLGEIWYSLNLEDMKQIRVRQQATPFGGMPQRRFR
ncbi:MAG: hypothetical protein J6X55_09270 [Victivallales bacterium]|nr:hypothetical protein [Victivallales bacterium]